MEIIALGLLLITIAGMSKAVMDRIVHLDLYKASVFYRYKDFKLFGKYKIFSEIFWNKDKSWFNKWKLNNQGKMVEKFPGSSTVFVWTTDAWHFFQAIFLFTLFAGLMLYSTIIGLAVDFVIARIYFSLVFEAFFRLLRHKPSRI